MQPLSVTELIIGWTMEGIISTVIQSIPLMVLSAFILISSQSILNIILILIIILVTFFSGFCMATILVALMVNWKETDQLVSFVGNIAPFICGVIVPLNYIPTSLKYTGVLFPFTWGLDIIRYILFNTPPLFCLEIEVLIFVIVVIVYYLLAKFLFRKLYNLSRKNGGVIGY